MSYLRQFFQLLVTPFRVLLTSPQQLIATPRRLLGLSLAARISILLGVFLIVAVIVVACVRLPKADAAEAQKTTLLIAAVLAIVIPIVAYPVLKLWLEGEASGFEDIDRAWNAGLAELERNGLELTRLPLFLVIGSPGELIERKLFEASRMSLTVGPFPQGGAALHWYATDKAMYIVASEVGRLSAVATFGETVIEEDRKRQLMPAPAAPFNPHGGTMAPFNPHGGTLELNKVADIRETIATPPPMAASAVAQGPRPGPPSAADYRGTMMVSSETVGPGTIMPGPLPSEKSPIRLSRDEVEMQPRRLRYLCQLIRRTRQPFCPVNGLVTLLPYNVIQRGGADAAEVQGAVQSDLKVLANSFRLRIPTVALVIGLERESGFRELIRRVGFERARAQRFGKGFRVRDEATPEQLGALCIWACGAFEDFIYGLFKEKDSLTNPDKAPGNRKLYSLLCQIRRDFQKRLDRILADGFGHDSDGNGRASPVLFGGCYFAAVGPNEATQAFVRGVLHDRLLEEEKGELFYEEVEWQPGILREDAWFQRLSYACFALDAVLVVAAAAIFLLK